MPLHVQTLKDTFLRGTDRKEMEKPLKWSHVKKKIKKRKKTKKLLFFILLTLYKIFVLLSICSV